MQIYVRGRPYAQTRARHVQTGDKMVTYSSASKGLKKWRSDLLTELKRAKASLGLQPLEGAVCVDMVFMLPVKDKRRHGEVCHTKPDKDNLEKAVLDMMEKAGLFALGDSQVGVGQVVKLWCAPGQEGCQIQLKRVRVAKKIPAQGGDDEIAGWLSPSADAPA